MRKLVLLGLMALMALPALAAKKINVAQLEQALGAAAATHRADLDLARQLASFELTERLTPATLDRFAAKLPLGPRTALALQLLSDQSAFLDPPAAELPATAMPDAATQQRMADQARGYVVQNWTRLPSFFVTRTTVRFDDTPYAPAPGDFPVRAGLHPVGSTNRQVTFRDGQEVADATAAQTPAAQRELGLRTWGEFGPALTVVFTDTAKGTLTFAHWERASTGLVAVYRYAVPRAASHYSVSYCCMTEASVMVQRQSDGHRNMTRDMPTVAPNLMKPFTETPGYHGQIAIDPATGAILRITLEAELSNSDPLLRAATVVEYGPVTIGDHSFICPVRSLAFSMEETGPGHQTVSSNAATDQAWLSGVSHPPTGPILLVNETSFTHYHRLGTSLRLVANADADSAQPGAPPQSAAAGQPAIAAPGSASPAQAAAQPPAQPESQPVAQPPAQPTAPTAVPEMAIGEASGVPDQPLNSAQQQGASFQLKVSSRLVDVGIVAYDKKGHPVRDLKPEDFEVYDNGRRQEVHFLSLASADAPAAPSAEAAAPEQPAAFSNRASDASPAAAEARGATVLLMDQSHIAWADFSHARQEILRFLSTLAPGERVGLYAITRTGFKVLSEISTNHAALADVLRKWMPDASSVIQAQDEEMRNRQSFNEVHSVTDLNSVNGNQVDAPDTKETTDPNLLTEGRNPARDSLQVLLGVARHLSAVPGRKNLVWVSSDNVFADWQNQTVGIDKSPKMIDRFALHAQEAMNDAHVAVFPMDVSQLETNAINADIRTRNVELTQAAMDTATVAPQAGGAGGRNMAPGRITAEMQQDMHPIQGPIRQVADSTGGRVIRRAGDLAGELSTVVEAGHATYLLSFTPQGPADDQYHAIAVKLAGHHPGITLRSRTGYLFSKEPATLHDRFQQSVWRALDVSEIAVSAAVESAPAGVNLKLSIATADLGLEQQAGHWMDRLDIFFIQRDDAGIHAQVEGQTLGLRLKPATYQSLMPSGIPFEHLVQIKPGTDSLRILVVDENSGRMGSVTLPATALGPRP